MDFGLEVGFLLMGHGILNKFLLSRNLASSQDGILCGADSENWLHALCYPYIISKAPAEFTSEVV